MRTFLLLAALFSLTVLPLLPVEAASAERVVLVSNFAFTDPVSRTPVTEIAVGTTVRWVWTSGTHSVTEGVARQLGAPGDFDSGTLDTEPDGATSFEVTFETPGRHVYYCDRHATMRGVVDVK